MKTDDCIYAFLLMYCLNHKNVYLYNIDSIYYILFYSEVMNYLLSNPIEKIINLLYFKSFYDSEIEFEEIKVRCVDKPADLFYKLYNSTINNNALSQSGNYRMEIKNPKELYKSASLQKEITLVFDGFKTLSPFFPLIYYLKTNRFNENAFLLQYGFKTDDALPFFSDRTLPLIIHLLKPIKKKLNLSNMTDIYRFVLEHNKDFREIKNLYITNIFDTPKSVIYLNMLFLFDIFYKYLEHKYHIQINDAYDKFKQIIFKKIRHEIEYIYPVNINNIKDISISDKLQNNVDSDFLYLFTNYIESGNYDVGPFFGIKLKDFKINRYLIVNQLEMQNQYIRNFNINDSNKTIDEILINAYNYSIELYEGPKQSLNYTYAYDKPFYLVEEDIVPKMNLNGNITITKYDIRKKNKIKYPLKVDIELLNNKTIDMVFKYTFAKYFNKGVLHGRF